MDTSMLAVVALSVIAAGGVAYAVLYPTLSGQKRAQKRRKEFTAPASARVADREAPTRLKRGQVAKTLKEVEDREKARRATLESRLLQAGLTWDRKRFYLTSVIIGLVLALLFIVLTGNPVVALAAGFVGGFGLPNWYLARARNKRMKAFVLEFPNALDIIVRGVRSGLPLNDCLRIIAAEAREPVASEFRLIIESQQLGLSFTEAAEKLYERMPCPESNYFGIVLAIQQKTGGNLAETLANLSKVIRERRKMRDKIAAVSMEAKASAAIIGSLPIVVAILVYLTSPRYIEQLWLTQTGRVALLASAVWMLIGVMVMRKMINFNI